MRILVTVLTLSVWMVACSNPFSSRKEPVLAENPKGRSDACASVRLDDYRINPTQFRSIIRCLNQSHELQPMEIWAESLSDQEILPLSNQLSAIIQNDPSFLRSLSDVYADIRNQGEFEPLIRNIFLGLNTSEKRSGLITLLNRHSPWIRKMLNQDQYSIGFQNLLAMNGVMALQRFRTNEFPGDGLKPLLVALYRYRSHPDSSNFQGLFQLFSKIRYGILRNRKNAEKITAILNWLMEQDRLVTISKAGATLMESPIRCFNDGLKLDQPFETLLKNLSSLNPKRASAYFQKNLSPLLVLGNGYCTIPDSVMNAAEILNQAASLEGFTPFFALIQPLFRFPVFSKTLVSDSFRNLAIDLRPYNSSHLFQDMVTLGNWFSTNPVIQGEIGNLFDSIHSEFAPDEILFFLSLVPNDPLSLNTFQKIVSRVGKPKLPPIPSNQDWLAPFQKPEFEPVIALFLRMNDEKKIAPFLDRLIFLFRDLLTRGKQSQTKTASGSPLSEPRLPFSDWLLPRPDPIRTSEIPSDACARIPLRFRFFVPPVGKDQMIYFDELDRIARCFGSSQTFAKLDDLVRFIVKKDDSGNLFSKLNRMQSEALGFMIMNNHRQSLDDFERFIRQGKGDLQNLKRSVEAISKLLREAKEEIKTATALRKIGAELLSDPLTWKAIAQQTEAPLDSSEVSVEPLRVKLRALVLQSLPALFERHCKSLNVNAYTCILDRDQVITFRQSPAELADRIVTEYLDSFQSWIHPNDSKKWDYRKSGRKSVSSIEYHLNPLIHQIRNRPDAIEGAFDFLKETRKRGTNLGMFLKEKADRFTVVPYYFQNGSYPDQRFEFHPTARIRVLNDLDRLELLAINSDFKPFGWLKNFGMGFIREIATSWGDEPVSKRPQFGTSETLAEARLSIRRQHQRYESEILRRLGNCKSVSDEDESFFRVCNAELSDIHARIFNLGLLLDMMDSPSNMVFFRNLFYGFYGRNKPEQKDLFVDGVKEQRECILENTPAERCNADLLHLVPRITRLGLLHQTGLALAAGNTLATDAVVRILDHTLDWKLEKQFSEFLASRPAETAVRDLLPILLNSKANELRKLSSMLSTVSLVQGPGYLHFGIELANRNPHLIGAYEPTILHFLKTIDTKKTMPLFQDWLNLASRKMNSEIAKETSLILKDWVDTQDELQFLMDQWSTPESALHWIRLFSEPSRQKQRDQLASWVSGTMLNDFCDVFSDPQTVNKAYNFFESSNQNNGALQLIAECRRFLH